MEMDVRNIQNNNVHLNLGFSNDECWSIKQNPSCSSFQSDMSHTNRNPKANDNQHRNQTKTLLQDSKAPLRPIEKSPPQQKRTWFIWLVSGIQICVFITELIKNWLLTGRLIETNLSINPFFGPSLFVLINMGAFFPPCMHTMKDFIDIETINIPCPNTTTLVKYNCTFSDICGLNDLSSKPNQWYRFIMPIFLHAGIIHIALNLFSQLILGIEIERKIGVLRLATIYFASGIFGFVLSSNFGSNGSSTVGCSGSVFAILALLHLDLYYNWGKVKHPRIKLIILLVEIIFNFAFGLLPAIDNFCHIGGFFMGLLLGLALMDSPESFQPRKTLKYYVKHFDGSSYSRIYLKFCRNRTKIWWIMRTIAFVTAVVLFIVLIENFYTQMFKCNWCKYLSCLPIKNWCNIGRFSRINETTSQAPNVMNSSFSYQSMGQNMNYTAHSSE